MILTQDLDFSCLLASTRAVGLSVVLLRLRNELRTSRHSGPPRDRCYSETDHRLKRCAQETRAALVLASLVTEGRTEVTRLYHIDCGYEHLNDKLASLGAELEPVCE